NKLAFNLKNDNLFWEFMIFQFPVAHSRLLDIEEKRKQWDKSIEIMEIFMKTFYQM
ncbi:16863_t:CDS:1, partial [Gigaspora rosea]